MPPLRNVRDAWRVRPRRVSRSVWALALLLDRLPWPWGEDLLGASYLLGALLRRTRRREALAWAAASTRDRRARWRLAVSLCLNQGRFLARVAFVGVRDLESWRGRIRLRGEHHLSAAGRGALLVTFHLGPVPAHLALRVSGHELTWVGGQSTGRMWGEHRAGRGDDLVPRGRDARQWTAVLHGARHALLGGGRVFMSGDGGGRDAFTVPLPGGPLVVREGWLALRRATGAPVLPVLSHLEGRAHVLTVHPPLPAVVGDPARDVAACREALTPLLADYVRRFPEQCCALAFRAKAAATSARPSPRV